MLRYDCSKDKINCMNFGISIFPSIYLIRGGKIKYVEKFDVTLFNQQSYQYLDSLTAPETMISIETF